MGAVSTVLVVGLKIVTEGCWLIFLPINEKVETVTIEYPDVTSEAKEISVPDDIERCVNMLNMLKFDIFRKSQDTSEPLITYTYHLKDGTDLVVAANKNTVFYQGKQHVLKEEGLFVNITEGLFFLSEAVQQP